MLLRTRPTTQVKRNAGAGVEKSTTSAKKAKPNGKKSIKTMTLNGPVLCLQTRSLGQDVYDIIISYITDKPTLYSWQRVNRDCYRSATPRLYTGGSVNLSTKRQLCAFVTGVTGSDPNTFLLPPKDQVFNGLTEVHLSDSAAEEDHFLFAGEVDEGNEKNEAKKTQVFEICFAERGASYFPAMEQSDKWWQDAEDLKKRGLPLTTVLKEDIVVSFSTALCHGSKDRNRRSYGVLHLCLHEPHSKIGDERKKIEFKLRSR